MSKIVTHEAAAAALDSLDDCARMDISMDAIGPRGVLERYIAQQAASAAPAQEPLAWESTTPCYIRFVTDSKYQQFSREVQKWYRPICQKCAAPTATHPA